MTITAKINYPLSIRTFLLRGNSRTKSANFMATASRSGKTFFKKIAQDQNTYMSVTFKFTKDEALIFQSWFTETLEDGFLPFYMPICTEWGDYEYKVRFMPDSLLSASREDNLFSYSAQILIYEYGAPSWYPKHIYEFEQYYKDRELLDVIVNVQLGGEK